MKKAIKSTGKLELNFPLMTILKPLKYTPCLEHVRKKAWNLLTRDPNNLLTSKNDLKSSKQLKMIFLFMSVLNILQYKQCLCVLTLPKCNT